ncbi:MAG: signal peptidase II [Defluviicoccus sp.]|nr:signal peptidase II [Defluviicoccus sp.]
MVERALIGPARLGFLSALAVLVLDQLTKWWILAIVMQPPRVIEITPFFNLVLGWNRGISFGLFGGDGALNAWVLPVLAAAVVMLVTYWLLRARTPVIGLSLGLIIGGAIGNITDRLRLGAVVDFLDFHAFGFHWPAFNVADSGITIGAALMIMSSLFGDNEQRTRIKKSAERAERKE